MRWQALQRHNGYEELEGVQLVELEGITHRISSSARIEKAGSGEYLVLITGQRPVQFAHREAALAYASQLVDAGIAATIKALKDSAAEEVLNPARESRGK